MGPGEFPEEKMAHRKVEDRITEKFKYLVGFFVGAFDLRVVHLMNIGLVGEGFVEPNDIIELVTEPVFQFL